MSYGIRAITYPTYPATQMVTDGEFMVIQGLYSVQQKVLAIKFARMQYNLGLHEAKQLCEKIASET